MPYAGSSHRGDGRGPRGLGTARGTCWRSSRRAAWSVDPAAASMAAPASPWEGPGPAPAAVAGRWPSDGPAPPPTSRVISGERLLPNAGPLAVNGVDFSVFWFLFCSVRPPGVGCKLKPSLEGGQTPHWATAAMSEQPHRRGRGPTVPPPLRRHGETPPKKCTLSQATLRPPEQKRSRAGCRAWCAAGSSGGPAGRRGDPQVEQPEVPEVRGPGRAAPGRCTRHHPSPARPTRHGWGAVRPARRAQGAVPATFPGTFPPRNTRGLVDIDLVGQVRF